MTYSKEAELGLLRALFHHPEKLKEIDIEESDFFNESHRKYFRAMKNLSDRGEKIDLSTLVIETDEIVSFLESWVGDYEHWDWRGFYSGKVKRDSVLRRMKAALHDFQDPVEIISEIKKLELKLENKTLRKLEDVFESYKEAWKEKQERRKSGRGIGLVTGMKTFDLNVPLERGQLITLAARSSVGKSAFALNIALDCARFGQNVLYFSIEMSPESLIDRMAALCTDTPVTRFKNAEADASLGLLNTELGEAMRNLRLEHIPQATSDEVCRLSRVEAIKAGKVDLIIVDYLQYLADPVGRGTNNERVSNMTRKFKSLAGELNCVVLQLSQVNRKATLREEGRPALEDLRDSGSIEQDSDTVLILNRENRDDVMADLVVAKYREGLADQQIKFKFKPSTTKFTEL